MDIAWFMDGLKDALLLNRDTTWVSVLVRAVLLVADRRVGSREKEAARTSGRDKM
jgi:hypothetical protein